MQIVSQEEDIPQEALLAMGIQRKIDDLEATMKEMPPIDCPLTHTFTEGLYTRTIFMPAGSLIVSKIHKTQHPFFVSKGKAAVWTQENGVILVEAPFVGITEPGTRRVLYIYEDCVWSTVHSNPENEDVEKIEARIIEPRVIEEIENMNNLAEVTQ